MSEFSICVIFIASYLLTTISFQFDLNFEINLRNIINQVGFTLIGLKSITNFLMEL